MLHVLCPSYERGVNPCVLMCVIDVDLVFKMKLINESSMNMQNMSHILR